MAFFFSAACGGAAFLLLLLHALGWLWFPVQHDYGEGYVLQLMDAAAHGAPLYRDVSQYPWFACLYAPLYIRLGAALMPWLGQGYVAGRLLSLVAAAGTVAVVAWAAGRRGGRVAAGVSVAVLTCSPLLIYCSALCRVDVLAVFFEVAALALVDGLLLRSGEAGSRRLGGAVAAGVMFGLALWTKQSYVLGAAAALLVLMRSRLWREAAALCGALAICLLVPFAFIDRGEAGQMLWLLFRCQALAWNGDLAWLWARAYLPTIIAAGMIAGWFIVGARGFRSAPLWVVYLGLSSLTLLNLGRVGVYYNHLLPLQVAVSMVCGLSVAEAFGADGARRTRLVLGSALVVQLVGGALQALPPTLAPLYAYAGDARVVLGGKVGDNVRRASEELEQLRAALDRFPGPIIAENLGAPVQMGRPAALCDPSSLFAMAEKGLWDEGQFIDMVKQKRFSAIVLQRLDVAHIRFSSAAMRAMLEAYRPAFQLHEEWVLVPR